MTWADAGFASVDDIGPLSVKSLTPTNPNATGRVVALVDGLTLIALARLRAPPSARRTPGWLSRTTGPVLNTVSAPTPTTQLTPFGAEPTPLASLSTVPPV